MRRLVWAVVLAAGAAPALAAQGSTAELLGQAHQFYEGLEVERALPLLRQIISPNWPFEVTRDQRVDAYKYLGACLAVAGKRDSAVLYFRAAIERDPFTDLDPSLFTPAQLATFAEARRRTLAVAVRPAARGRGARGHASRARSASGAPGADIGGRRAARRGQGIGRRRGRAPHHRRGQRGPRRG